MAMVQEKLIVVLESATFYVLMKMVLLATDVCTIGQHHSIA